jgi:hypothetical protein
MRQLYIVLLATITITSAPVAAAIEHDPEAHYRELWREIPPPFAQRRVVGKWHVPVFSELHAAIKHAKATAKDSLKGKLVLQEFRSQGAFRSPTRHVRVTCRHDLCEHVVIYDKKATASYPDEALSALNRAALRLCPQEKCQVGAIVGGDRDSGNISMLGYLIPVDQGFI